MCCNCIYYCNFCDHFNYVSHLPLKQNTKTICALLDMSSKVFFIRHHHYHHHLIFSTIFCFIHFIHVSCIDNTLELEQLTRNIVFLKFKTFTILKWKTYHLTVFFIFYFFTNVLLRHLIHQKQFLIILLRLKLILYIKYIKF